MTTTPYYISTWVSHTKYTNPISKYTAPNTKYTSPNTDSQIDHDKGVFGFEPRPVAATLDLPGSVILSYLDPLLTQPPLVYYQVLNFCHIWLFISELHQSSTKTFNITFLYLSPMILVLVPNTTTKTERQALISVPNNSQKYRDLFEE